MQGVRFAFLGFSAINSPIWATETEPGVGPLELDLAPLHHDEPVAPVAVVDPAFLARPEHEDPPVEPGPAPSEDREPVGVGRALDQ